MEPFMRRKLIVKKGLERLFSGVVKHLYVGCRDVIVALIDIFNETKVLSGNKAPLTENILLWENETKQNYLLWYINALVRI